MKNYLKVLFLILFGIGTSFAQISVTVGSVIVSPTDTLVTIPITVTNFNGIGAISLKFKYTDAVLSWRNAANWNTGSQATNIAYANNGTASLSIFSLSSIRIGTGKMVDLVFRYNGGATDLTFDVPSCEISDSLGNVLQSSYVNGFVKPQFTITTASNPALGGTTSGGGLFFLGQQDTVKAVPSLGFSFINWTEGQTVVSTNANYGFTVSANRNFTANFQMAQYTISTASNPVNGGTTTGGGTFIYGQPDTVKAVPAVGFSFKNWTEGQTVVSTNASYGFTVTASRSLTANFDQIQYTIATSSSPANGGTTTGGGTFTYGQQVSVKASVNSGYAFVNWTEGQTVVSTDSIYNFAVSQNRTLVANFVVKQPTTFKISGNVTYDNSVNTPLTATKIYLKKDGITVDSTMTDTLGNYSFNSVANGTYTLDGFCTKEWAGVNSTDALNIRKYQVGTYTLEGLRFKAGDNNGNGATNSTDALNIRKRLASLISSFPIPDWVFDTPTVIVNGANVVQNMKGLCTGDVNGSNVPTN